MASCSGLKRAAAGVLFAAGPLLAASPLPAQVTGTLTGVCPLRSSDGNTANFGNDLTLGSDGNFYGTTVDGGTNSYGEVFRVTPAGDLTILHSFNASTEGSFPYGKLLLANDGNFYGTTSLNGPSTGSNAYGTVFRMTPGGTTTVLHTFNGTIDGQSPKAGLIQGSDGNLYGTTFAGGTNGNGTIFQISLAGRYRIVYSFGDGGNPRAPLVQGSDGNYYGVAGAGGSNGAGTVYQMTPAGQVTTLHTFAASEGTGPVGALAEGSNGVFYGVTGYNGVSNLGYGSIFRIASDGTFAVLYRFTGGRPNSGFVRAADGSFYVPTSENTSSNGNIVRCTPDGAVTTVCAFRGGTDAAGNSPLGGLTPAGDGSFYGVTAHGGANVSGAVFRLTISDHPAFFNGQVDLGSGVDYLQFPNGNVFGYYKFLSDPHYIYHFDLGFEYVFDMGDGHGGVAFYDFKSGDFLYTSPTYPFPYLYDFTLRAALYYYADPNNPGHYNTNGVRYFFNFATGRIISR